MKKSRFTEEQIVFALEQAVLGTSVPEVCRELGISDATFYTWCNFAFRTEAHAAA